MIVRLLLVCCFSWLPLSVMAETDVTHPMTPALDDQASLQRGVGLFVNHCMGCHSLQYQRFSRAAEDLGIPRSLVEKSLIQREGVAFEAPMLASMSAEQGADWLGAAPPDLTLVASQRGSDWLYSFLLGFYRDPAQPHGVNNQVFPGVSMPHVLEPMQGRRARVCEGDECRVQQVAPGSLSPKAFEQAMFDLTNFLVYTSDPSRLKAASLAPWVLIFLLVFVLAAYLLKREYWRDI